MKFLCDQMCLVLGRWLRTAGYDTLIIDRPMEDLKIYKMALQEGRTLITRDRDFLKLDPEEKTIIHLEREGLDEWAKQLKERGVDWLLFPFSRCLRCNTLLKTPPPSAQIPANITEATFCPTCNGVFWLGSHTSRMEKQLKKWRD